MKTAKQRRIRHQLFCDTSAFFLVPEDVCSQLKALATTSYKDPLIVGKLGVCEGIRVVEVSLSVKH